MAAQATRAIIGTAGHIDHGKTALVKALTGQETDRLKEEKERGISIDIGFAYFVLPDGARAGVVDVPGHERFIRNMLAGAHGVDLVLFTVAADDGVMPQSEEHLDILHLLGARRGVFAITKSDLVSVARIAQVRDEIGLLAQGTAFEEAPVIAVSSVTGQGLDQLRAEMIRRLQGFQARRATGLFRLPLDRAFTIKGRGTVVTGTAMGATVAVGQKLRVLPGGDEVKVRAIQVHGENVERAGLCQRVGLNLSGAEKLELRRGVVLADERLDFATSRLDAIVEIRPVAKRPLKNNQRLRFFIATSETLGRAIVLEPAGAIAPKTRGLVQIVLDDPVVALSGDRFIIRDETNVRTIGGGVVLNPLGRRARKPLEDYRANLATLASGSAPEAIEALLSLLETVAAPVARIARMLNLPAAEVEQIARSAQLIRLSMGDEEGFTTRAKWEELKKFALATLAGHHKSEPLSPGVEMEALRSRLPYRVSARSFRGLLDRLERETDIVREESIVRLKNHRVTLAGDEGRLAREAEAVLRQARFQPPEIKQLAGGLGLSLSDLGRVRAVLSALEREGRVVKIATDLYFERSAVDAAREFLTAHLAKTPDITAAAYRDLLGTSRKFAIALLDHFDRAGVTMRVGDVRRLRQNNPPSA